MQPDGQQRCRFNFPKPLKQYKTAVFTNNAQGQIVNLEVYPATNDPYLNKFNSHCLSCWRANMDISITFRMTQVGMYIAKDTSKAEQATNDYAVMLNAIATDQLPAHANLKAVANALLLTTISRNDISAQQATHILSDIPLYKSSRHFVKCQVDSNIIQDRINQWQCYLPHQTVHEVSCCS